MFISKTMMGYKYSFIQGASIKAPDSNVYTQLLRRSKFNASPLLAVCHEDELTIERLKTESEIYAKAFIKLGVKKGDIVPIGIPPGIEGIILFYALNRIGAVATFLESTAGKEEILHYIGRFSSSVFIAGSRFAELLPDIVQEAEKLSIIVISAVDTFGKISNPCKLTQELLRLDKPIPRQTGIYSFSEFLGWGRQEHCLSEEPGQKDDPALISFTSGTTGEPKAIVLSNGNIMAEMISLCRTTHLQLVCKGNYLQVVPFNYPYGFLISVLFPMFVGKTSALTPLLRPQNIKAYLEWYKPPYIQAIPSVYTYLIHAKEFEDMDLSFLRYAVTGGDKLELTEKKLIIKFFREHKSRSSILDGSGNGEGCGCLTTPVVFGKSNIQSVGKPSFGLSMKFIDKNKNAVLVGEIGKMCFSGKMLMLEYYNDQEATAKVKYKYADGTVWFHTDTLGHMDKNGWIYLDGRERRYFITFDESGSPFKVYCEHVQDIINRCSEIRTCAVVQCPDDKRSLIPVVFLVPESDIAFTKALEKIQAMCGKELQSFARPVKYFELAEIPLTRAKKVDYTALETWAVDHITKKANYI